MLDNALSTKSVTKHSVISNQVQKLDQTNILHIVNEPRIHGLFVIDQSSAEQKNTVTRETLTTRDTSYLRLLSIDTSQKNAEGKSYNFSPILGVWSRSEATESDNSLAQLYGQNVAVPYADLPATARGQLLEQVTREGVYKVDFAAVRRERQNGRDVYVYPVVVKPAGFINMMKSIGKVVGLGGYNDVDPSAYNELPEVSFTFSVDVLSGDLNKVTYSDGQTEDYSATGLRRVLPDPQNSITVMELQQRLQSL